jgi:peptide/nickel transport system permease protein
VAAFVRRRLVAVIPLVLLTTSLVFSLILLLPGDPAVALVGLENVTEEKLATVRERMGLNRPLYVQYGLWLARAAQGDLGTSLRTGQPVIEALRDRLPVTLGLAVAATAFGLVLGFPLAVVAASKRGGFMGSCASAIAAFGVAVPNFWLGSMLVLALALHLRWLPATGYASLFDSPGDAIRHAILPTLTLGASAVAEITRQLRSALQDTLATDYVRTARAKGIEERRVIWKHALRNALIPMITVSGLTISRLVGATVVVESIFALPGLGRLNLEAVLTRDFPMLQGAVLVMVLIVIAVNFVSDLIYGWADPRIRLS